MLNPFAWLTEALRSHPEIAFFLVLGLGYLAGKLALGGFKLGAVTGTLLAGVVVGQLGIPIANDVKQCFFLLFLFAIGFRTGPQFFRGLRSDGLTYAALAAIVACTGLVVAYAVALVLGFDPGTAAGLVAGALTESAALGTAMETIANLDVGGPERAALESNLAVAFAVTYLIGMTASPWILAQLGPKLLSVDLAAECRKLEDALQGQAAPLIAARREFELRAYVVEPGSRWVGLGIDALERAAPGQRVFVESVRRAGQILALAPHYVMRTGDVVAAAARRATLVEVLERSDSGLREVDDKELLDVPGDVVDVVVTNAAIDGRTLSQLAQDEVARGVFLKRITRSGHPLGIFPLLTVHRGDVITIVGSVANIARATELIGVADRATDATDMLAVSAAIVAGALIGLPAVGLGEIEIGISLPVGVLLGGLVLGWLRSVRPRWVGRVPTPALWVFESIGLTGFVAVVGLNAGPDFVAGLAQSGVSLVLAGTVTVTSTLVIGLLIGRALFKLHPGILIGVVAGGCTNAPALAAVQEAARSTVPSIGYGVAYAVGNVLLALWGTVIVALLV